MHRKGDGCKGDGCNCKGMGHKGIGRKGKGRNTSVKVCRLGGASCLRQGKGKGRNTSVNQSNSVTQDEIG